MATISTQELVEQIDEKMIAWLDAAKNPTPCWVVLLGDESSRRLVIEEACYLLAASTVRLRPDMTQRQLLAAVSDALEVPRGLSIADMEAQISDYSRNSDEWPTLVITAADHLLFDEELFFYLGKLSYMARLPMLVGGGELWRQFLDNDGEKMVLNWLKVGKPKPASAGTLAGQG